MPSLLNRLADDLILLGAWKRAGLALVVGAVSALAMAPFHAGFVLFLTLPVLVFLLDGADSTKPGAGWLRRQWPAFAVGWCFGFGYFVAGLWWIGQAFLVEAEEFAVLLPVAVAGLPALLGLFYGVAATVARALSRDGWTRVVALAVAFGAAEWLRGHVLTGFPWNALGYAALPNVAMMGQAALWGLYGVTFLTVLAAAAPALLVRPRAADTAALVAIILLGAGSTVAGVTSQAATDRPGEHRIRLVQPAVDQREKWLPGKAEEMFRRHLALSQAEPLDGLTYVIWPESAFAFLIQRQPNALAAIADMLPPGVRLVTGGMRGEDFSNGVPARVWNSVLVLDDGGAIVESGDKTHLVPFGEYLPLSPVLRAIGLRQLVARGGFEAGRERLVMQAASPSFGPSFLPLVCYEVIFPGGVRTSDGRPDFLLNLTNDAWFGMTPGPYQHAHQAQVRAAEAGLPMVRVANSGISFVADGTGTRIATLPLGARDAMDTVLPPPLPPTLYWRLGDLPFATMLLVSLALLAAAGLARSRARIRARDGLQAA